MTHFTFIIMCLQGQHYFYHLALVLCTNFSVTRDLLKKYFSFTFSMACGMNYTKYDISYTFLYLSTIDVNLYQVKMLVFYNVQTTNATFVSKK